MKPRALVIDDDAEIIRTVGDILESLNHTFDSAGDQETARNLLAADKYAYILLDLEIPVKPGKLCRIKNGENLLSEIRATAGMETIPVIVMTGHGNDSPDLAVAVWQKGATHYVKKPFNKGELDEAILKVLAKDGQAAPAARVKAGSKKLTPFKDAKREMVIGDDSVTICGIEVWRETYQPDMRKILVRLSQREGGGYVRISGSKLMKELGRDASNPVGRPIKSFCDNASERLAEGRSLACGRYDIIASKGGYHFTEWMEVRVDGEPEPPKDYRTSAHKSAETDGGPALNDRQTWILEQLDQGIELRHKDIVRHTRKNRSTINRDLKELRDRGLITTHVDGYYVRVQSAKSKGGSHVKINT